jgi:hypothetical protein
MPCNSPGIGEEVDSEEDRDSNRFPFAIEEQSLIPSRGFHHDELITMVEETVSERNQAPRYIRDCPISFQTIRLSN